MKIRVPKLVAYVALIAAIFGLLKSKGWVLLLLLLALAQSIEGTTITQIAAIQSPDHAWTAKIVYEDYPSMFSIPAYVVELEPVGWLGRWRKERVAEIEDMNKNVPTITWKMATALSICANDPVHTVMLKKATYKGIAVKTCDASEGRP